MKDAIEYLLDDHREHRRKLERCLKSPGNFHALRDDLIHHINLEEAVLYPHLLEIELTEEKVHFAWEEHRLLMQLLQEMDGIDPADVLWSAKLNALSKLLLAHLDEEEKELFPKIRKVMKPEVLKEMTVELEQQRGKVSADEILYPEEEGAHQRPPSPDA